MNTVELAEWLESYLPRIPRLNLNPERIRVTHVLNWGGFVNHSFSINDGTVRYHLKITDDVDSISKLQGWRKIHDILEQRYRAPALIDWMDFPDIGFAGLLLQQINGGTANFCENPSLVEQLIELTCRLHQDAEIRSHLNPSGLTKTCLDHFVETYIDRFTADLEVIAAGQLRFISSELLSWMRHETQRLNEGASCERAFHNPVVKPIHGDLNEGNVLVTTSDWFVVDWDDLALGDPAVEFAVLLWPMIYQGKMWSEFSIPAADDGFAKRIGVCLRAQLLDEVIDPLADYAQAHVVPSRQSEVQCVKRERHEEALERYRTIWPG